MSSDARCRGMTKQGAPCSVTWGLSPAGFCKFHAPDAQQCKGLARASGRRCKIKWSLDERGFCEFHRRVDAPATRRCAAVAATGRRCPQTVGIDADGFCTAHRAARAELPLCRGVLWGSDERCINNAKVGYDFCCAAHDPALATSFVAPSLFNEPGLRSSVEGDIVKRFKSRDLYHGDKLDLNTVGAVELDHILEKQCFAYAFQRVEFRGNDEEAQDVAFMLREEIVNELPNLCLTRATTNKIKGAAVSKFLDDSLTGHRAAKTFTDYLLAEKRDETQLARDVTQTIRKEMGSALRRCQWKLADEGETPALDALSAELQQLYVDMDLHTSHFDKMKSWTAAPTAVKEQDPDDEYVLVDSTSTDSWSVVDVKPPGKTEGHQPVLSADAKPFVPGAVQLAPAAATESKVKADPCKIEPYHTKPSGSFVYSSSKVSAQTETEIVKHESASPQVRKEAVRKQMTSESTSKGNAENKNAESKKDEDTKCKRELNV
ncbi:unnamed protein product [Phytophthora lilii]|uniref:Unnamed protein product n=1 Tax=Phytophthora lilii TaxID=2077276 RepID=A0A9W6THY2_9STRA|nr:unnamed protein product [Phytophthora lilii]